MSISSVARNTVIDACRLLHLGQFSLRSALFGMTALCVWLGFRCEQARQQRSAVAAIRAIRGRVIYDYEDRGLDAPRVPQWLRKATGDDLFATVTAVSFDFDPPRATDAVMPHVGRLASLRVVNLNETEVTDAGLRHLCNLFSLRQIHLEQTPTTARGLSQLAGLTHLRRIYLRKTKPSGGIRYLREMRELTHLDLINCDVSDDDVADIAALKSLRWVPVAGCERITDQALPYFLGLSQLRELDLAGTQISDVGAALLAGSPGSRTLTRVDVRGTLVTEAGWRRLRDRLPRATVPWGFGN